MFAKTTIQNLAVISLVLLIGLFGGGGVQALLVGSSMDEGNLIVVKDTAKADELPGCSVRL